MVGGLVFDGKTYIDLGDVVGFERMDVFFYGVWVNVCGGGVIILWMDDVVVYCGWDVYILGWWVEVYLINMWFGNVIHVISKVLLFVDCLIYVFVIYDGLS